MYNPIQNNSPLTNDSEINTSDTNSVNSNTNIEKLASNLSEKTNRLRYIGRSITIYTFFNVVLLFLSTSLFSILRNSAFSFTLIFSFMSIILTIIIVVNLIIFESLTRLGNVIFEELSDSSQWKPISAGGNSPNLTQIDINIRFPVRDFLSATDLLFFPGKFGSAFYFVVNIALSFATMLFRYRY